MMYNECVLSYGYGLQQSKYKSLHILSTFPEKNVFFVFSMTAKKLGRIAFQSEGQNNVKQVLSLPNGFL